MLTGRRPKVGHGIAEFGGLSTGDHGHDTGEFTGRIGVNTIDASMSIGAAYHRHVKHAMEFNVINIG